MFGIFIAFKNIDYSKGIFGSDWVGFQNFMFLFKTKDAWIMTRNTILYNLIFIVLGTFFAIVVAILMCEITKHIASRVFQSALILPNLISMVIVSYIVFAFLSSDTGLINNSILKPLGIPSVSWYMKPAYWPYIITLIYLWKNVGYYSIIFVAGISGIDKSIYEAAKMDGAGKLMQIRKITLPLLRPTVIILILMCVGRIMYSDFGLFYQVPMNSGALYATTQTIDTYVYRGLMQMNDIGMSAAAGFYQSVIGFIIVLVTNAIVRKTSPEDSLF